MEDKWTGDELLTFMEALSNPYRLRIVAILQQGDQYVSQLSRELGISRPLLYLHLHKLEEAHLVEGRLELSSDGKAMKYYKLRPFDVPLNAQFVAATVDSLTVQSKTKS